MVLTLSGVETSIYKAHSTRAAATSATKRNLSVDEILRTAGWSNATTFENFYDKPIMEEGSFSNSILNTLESCMMEHPTYFKISRGHL